MLSTKALSRSLHRLCHSAIPSHTRPPAFQRSFSSQIGDRSEEITKTKHRRLAVIQDPSLNRGTGFSSDERERLCLRGLVPPRHQPLEQQIQRVMKAYARMHTNLDKFQFLSLLMDRNTVLFYRILVDHFDQLARIVYTPVVGEACQKFHALYRRTRGMYFSVDDRPYFRSMVYNWPTDDVDVIVVTDGSRVLALGDLGCNSMNIPIGKLALYVAGAGLSPTKTLPVVLDVGTNNEQLRNNPLYLGLPRPRITGQQYYDLLDEWISAVRTRWPNALIQFEDFSSEVAQLLLNRYRHSHAPVFNDDIQSTGCIAVASVLSSLRARGKPASALSQEVFVCAGAGSAGLGVCEALVQAMIADGTPMEEAYGRFYIIDKTGLLGSNRNLSTIPESAKPFVRNDYSDGVSLLEVVHNVKPTVLLGLSGQGGLFTEEVIVEMNKHVVQPVIFPMSNPSDASECSAEQAFSWTGGQAIFASGSPFDNVVLGDGTECISNQANNVYSFPGLGLAVTIFGISYISDSMFLAAARTISELVPTHEVKRGLLFPPVSQLRAVSAEVAASVARVAIEEGLTRRPVPEAAIESHEAFIAYIQDQMWEPIYGHLVAE